MASKLEVEFAFDIVCPYAYLASTRIRDIEVHTGARFVWTPVLLGGLYELSQAPQGKDGSASSASAPARQRVESEDFQREIRRYDLPLKWHPQHPLRSVDAQRLLCATPESHRPILARALYAAYWQQNLNISQRAVLLRVARNAGLRDVIPLDDSVFAVSEGNDPLRENTQRFHERGAFGVPSFYLPARDKLFFGQDRLHLVEAALASIKTGRSLDRVKNIERLLPRTLRTPPETRTRKLIVHLDLSSPWSYLAYCQLEGVRRDAGPSLTMELRPVLVGALFKIIGTPTIPMAASSPLQQAYSRQDLHDWSDFLGAVALQEVPPVEPPNFRWPSNFPIRSALPLRVVINEPRAWDCLFRAAWRDDKRIDEPESLAAILNAAGFPGRQLVEEATTGEKADAAKQTLRDFTDQAAQKGLCGVPTFELGKHLVFGQDRLNVVQDLLCGTSD